MKTTVKKLSDTRVELKVTLDAKDLAPAKEKAIANLAKEVKIDKFRKGKAPLEIAKKFIPENDINSAAVDIAVRETVPTAINDSKTTALAIINVEVKKYVPNEIVEYSVFADVLPVINLANLKELGVKREEKKIAEKDVEEILNNIAGSYAEKKVTKRAAQNGDEVIIDFVGKRDGEPFSGGSAKDYKLTLGSKTFIPGFEEGIIGHEPGDKFDLNLTFPKDYGMKNLAGQKVVFETLLKQVNEIQKPEIDDEFAKKCGPFKTLKDLKDDIKKNLEAQNAHQLEEKFKNDLIAALVKKSKISVPEVILNDQLRLVRDDVERNAKSQGLTFEQLLERVGQTEEEWLEEAKKVAEERAKASLALQILARDKKLDVAEELVDAKIAELKEVYQKAPEVLKNLKKPEVRANIKNSLIIEKAIDLLVKSQK